MSNDLDDLEGDDLVNMLRKQLKEKDKLIKEASESLTEIKQRDRSRTLSDVLKEAKVSPKLAKFFPTDADATPESVESWLTENADLFGYQTETESPDEKTTQATDAYGRLANIQSPQGDQGGDAAVLHQISQATSEAELVKMIHAAGGGGL